MAGSCSAVQKAPQISVSIEVYSAHFNPPDLFYTPDDLQRNNLMKFAIKKDLTRLFVFIVAVMASTIALSQEDPRQTLQASVDTLIAEFTDNRAELEADKQKLYAFAEHSIERYWDFAKMSQLVLGKNWRTITDDQKQRFTEAFKGLLVRTYSSTMFKYTGKEAITFEDPIYKGKSNNRALVNARGDLGDGSEPIPLAFSMFQDAEGKWMIYNVAAAGISLVLTYRTSFGQIIAGKGIDNLIDSLNAKAKG